jgi:hypothetical protein
VTGGDINHGTNYNVVADSLQYGMQFTGVQMLAGQILIKNSAQVNFDNCWLSSKNASLPFTSTNSNFVVANSTFMGTVVFSESGVHSRHNFYSNRLNYSPGLVTAPQRVTDSLLWCLNPATSSFTANTLATPRAINGVNFDGSAAITIAADFATLANKPNFVTTDSNNITNLVTLSSQDLNLLTGNRMAYCTSPTNGPSGNGVVGVYALSTSVIFQTFINTVGAYYFRVTTTGSSGWGGWKQILNNGTAVTVAQGGTGVTSSTGSVAVVLSTSPTLAGTPLAPTASVGTNTTQIATTAYVQANAVVTSTGRIGTATLSSGTVAVSITGVTTSSKAFVTRTIASGTTLTTGVTAVCTAGTLTITADIAAGTINTADGSTYNYMVVN